MNPQEDPRLLIVALKGLPITVAGLLCKYRQPVSQAHLCDVIDSSDKTMSRALHRLLEFQILTHSEEGWSVTANVTLLGFSLPEWLQEAEESVDTCPVDTCPADGFPQEKGRNFSDPDAPSSTSSSYLTNLKLEKNLLPKLLGPEPEVYAQPEPKFKPDSKPELEPVPEPEPELATEHEPETDPKHGKRPKTSVKYQECYKTALAAGIWEEKARELAELAHVTPELITHHVQRVWAEGKELPLAIWRIKKNWEIRKPPERKTQGYEDRQKYVTGKFADWVNH